MRQAEVFFKGESAAVLTQNNDGSFIFRYHDMWMSDSSKASISLNLQKDKQQYDSEIFFPFFLNMLPEGANKQLVCKLNRIDNDDYFGLLMATATTDTIGAVTVKQI